MSNYREINYWIRGDPMDNIRTFRVKDTQTHVATRELKEHAILALDLDLSQLQLDSMTVYQVPEPVMIDDSSDNRLGSFSTSLLGKPLRSERNLLSLKPPSPDQLHFIIVSGVYKVHFWCRGAEDDDGFTVSARYNSTVSELKEQILSLIKVKPNLGNASVLSRPVKLYKISVHSRGDLSEALDALGERLKGDDQLHHAFRDVHFSESLALAIDWHDEQTRKPPPVVNSLIKNDPIYSARNQFVTTVERCAPSRSGALSSFRRQQGLEKKNIPCGRPQPSSHCSIDETIPPTLLSPIFNEFVHDCQNIEVTADDNLLIQELRVVMSDLYTGENERVNRVVKVLKRFGIELQLSRIHDYVMDGTMSTNGHYYVIAEFKNEIGSTSAEPYFEAISYFVEATRNSAVDYLRSSLPCFLVSISGSLVIFAAATWNLRPTVQVLPPPLLFHSHPTDIRNHTTIARHLVAFRKATQSLHAYYSNLKASCLTTAPKFIFPYPTSYESLSRQEKIVFQYDDAVDETKLIFFATEEASNDKICVKFVHAYSREAHETLARLGHAPSLRGLERFPGGQWIMVVFDALIEFQTLLGKIPISSSLFHNMSETLAAFHKAGYVHGDIRDVNIMVCKKDRNKFMFVDFDWSGRIGEVRYPSCVNKNGIKRPDDVVDGKLITVEHDNAMLSYLHTLYF